MKRTIKYLWDNIKHSLYIIAISEGEEKKKAEQEKKTFKGIMAQNGSILMKNNP